MPVEMTDCSAASEADALSQIAEGGFAAESKIYSAGKTEPHRHDYDICLHILAGEFRLGIPDEGVIHSFGPGDRVFVPAGTLHFEDHGPLEMVVGRRPPAQGSAFRDSEGG
jgi:mannose-6-phosphate isomerase-like protein (cupin superfamily)